MPVWRPWLCVVFHVSGGQQASANNSSSTELALHGPVPPLPTGDRVYTWSLLNALAISRHLGANAQWTNWPNEPTKPNGPTEPNGPKGLMGQKGPQSQMDQLS